MLVLRTPDPATPLTPLPPRPTVPPGGMRPRPGTARLSQTLWHLQIDPAAGRTDTEGRRIAAEAAELGLPGPWHVRASRGFLVEGALGRDDLRRAAETVLADPVTETFAIHPCGPIDAEQELPRLAAIAEIE